MKKKRADLACPMEHQRPVGRSQSSEGPALCCAHNVRARLRQNQSQKKKQQKKKMGERTSKMQR